MLGNMKITDNDTWPGGLEVAS